MYIIFKYKNTILVVKVEKIKTFVITASISVTDYCWIYLGIGEIVI